MNSVTLRDDRLVVEPKGLDKLWSFTRTLELALDHVRGATFDPGADRQPKGLRAPGLALPGKTSGTFPQAARAALLIACATSRGASTVKTNR